MMYSGDEDYGDEITSGLFPEDHYAGSDDLTQKLRTLADSIPWPDDGPVLVKSDDLSAALEESIRLAKANSLCWQCGGFNVDAL